MTRLTIEDINPELREVYRKFPNMPMHRYWFVKLLQIFARFGLMRTPIAEGIAHTDTKLNHGKVRIYQKASGERSGVSVFWIHAGELISGSCEQNNSLCSDYVNELDAVVCSTEYPLAPKYPFPAAVNDCFEACNWFLQQADNLGVDPNPVVIAGQSTGGGPAASLAQRVRGAGGIQPAAQILFCPMSDDHTATKTELDEIQHFGCTNMTNRFGWSSYSGHAAAATEEPDYALFLR